MSLITTFTGNCITKFNVNADPLGKRFWIVASSGVIAGSVDLEFSYDNSDIGWFSLFASPLVVSSGNIVSCSAISADTELYFRATSTGFASDDVVEIHVTGRLNL